jgi:hypothetical protein
MGLGPRCLALRAQDRQFGRHFLSLCLSSLWVLSFRGHPEAANLQNGETTHGEISHKAFHISLRLFETETLSNIQVKKSKTAQPNNLNFASKVEELQLLHIILTNCHFVDHSRERQRLTVYCQTCCSCTNMSNSCRAESKGIGMIS